eukprot:1184052-Prorocentrum_minimum.AAC.10
MIRRPPRSTQGVSSAASDVYKRQEEGAGGASRDVAVRGEADQLAGKASRIVLSSGNGDQLEDNKENSSAHNSD